MIDKLKEILRKTAENTFRDSAANTIIYCVACRALLILLDRISVA